MATTAEPAMTDILASDVDNNSIVNTVTPEIDRDRQGSHTIWYATP